MAIASRLNAPGALPRRASRVRSRARAESDERGRRARAVEPRAEAERIVADAGRDAVHRQIQKLELTRNRFEGMRHLNQGISRRLDHSPPKAIPAPAKAVASDRTQEVAIVGPEEPAGQPATADGTRGRPWAKPAKGAEQKKASESRSA